ncbi:MAG: HU family DNA-binding protein [Candidatus Pacebacteria bacterium]|nr:HU family DNA-binding protein [Candidatus Paceibacterota bacterium]
MTKDEIVDAVVAKTDFSKKDTEATINAVLETITKTLVEDGKVAFTGFGTFSVNKRAARTGVNPQHPEQKIQIPAMNVPKFKAGKSLKDAVR